MQRKEHAGISLCRIIGPISKVADLDVKALETAFRVNVFAVASLIRLALPHLRLSKGRIIITSSGIVHHPMHGYAAYTATKCAVNSIAMILAKEEPEVVVLAVEPGVVDTEMFHSIQDADPKALGPGYKEQHAKMALLKPEQPGTALAKLALAAPKEKSGAVCKWDDAWVQGL